MNLRSKANPIRPAKTRRRAVRKAAALSPDRQTLTAVYAMGIRDGLRIAADIRTKTRQAGEDAS